MAKKSLLLTVGLTLLAAIIFGIKIFSSPNEGLARVITINPGVGENGSYITVELNGSTLTLKLKSKQDCSNYKVGERFFLSYKKDTKWLIITFFTLLVISIFMIYKYFH